MYMYTCMYIYIYYHSLSLYIYVYIYMYIYIYVYVYIYIYVTHVTLIWVLPLFLPGTTHLTEMINGLHAQVRAVGSHRRGWRLLSCQRWRAVGKYPMFHWGLPPCKHTKSHGKSPFLMGKSTINGYKWAMFNSYVTNYQRFSQSLRWDLHLGRKSRHVKTMLFQGHFG